MRKFLLLLLVLALTPLTACSSLLEREYRSVSRHTSQTTDTEDTSILRVERYSDLVNSVQYFVSQGETEGVVHLYQYSGDVDQDLEDACQEVLTQDPLGAWALSGIDWESSRIVSYYECTFTFRYRHTAQEIQAVPSLVGITAIREAVRTSLTSYDTTLVFQASTYYAQQDTLLQVIQETYYDNPAYAQGYPSIRISLYPQESGGTQRVVEISLSYPGQTQALLQRRAEEVAAALSTLTGLHPSQDGNGCWLLCSRLYDQLDYFPEGSASVYAALVRGPADSQGTALAFQALCDQAQIPCQLVQGNLDGAPHWWNLVQLEEVWQHVDVTAGLDQSAFLRSDRQMEERYVWDRQSYPQCPDRAAESSDEDTADPQESELPG